MESSSDLLTWKPCDTAYTFICTVIYHTYARARTVWQKWGYNCLCQNKKSRTHLQLHYIYIWIVSLRVCMWVSERGDTPLSVWPSRIMWYCLHNFCSLIYQRQKKHHYLRYIMCWLRFDQPTILMKHLYHLILVQLRWRNHPHAFRVILFIRLYQIKTDVSAINYSELFISTMSQILPRTVSSKVYIWKHAFNFVSNLFLWTWRFVNVLLLFTWLILATVLKCRAVGPWSDLLKPVRDVSSPTAEAVLSRGVQFRRLLPTDDN